MQINIPTEIFGKNKAIELNDNKSMYIFIGANGSGKSKLMDQIKSQNPEQTKIISDNINKVSNIETLDEETEKNRSFGNKTINNVASLINADETIKQIIFLLMIFLLPLLEMLA